MFYQQHASHLYFLNSTTDHLFGQQHISISKKLDTIHNSGLRMSIGAYRSSSIPIYKLAGTHVLDIRRLKIILNHKLKLASREECRTLGPFLLNVP